MTSVRPALRPPAWLRIGIVVLVVVGVVVATVVELRSDANSIHAAIAEAGALAPLGFVLAHVLGSLVFVPRSLMAIVAGMLFSFWSACLLAAVGATAGALAGFLVARYVNAGLIVPEETSRIGPLLQRAEAGGWRTVVLVRLVPILPHALTNYTLGLTRIGIGQYTLGSAIGMAPETYLFVELSNSGRRALASGQWVEPLLWGLGFVALSIVVPRLLRRPPP